MGLTRCYKTEVFLHLYREAFSMPKSSVYFVVWSKVAVLYTFQMSFAQAQIHVVAGVVMRRQPTLNSIVTFRQSR